MGNLLTRRRELILASGIDCPYIKNGLIFWLDGINRGGVSGQWKDLIGGKIFTLHSCTEYANRVYFAGNTDSYASCPGAVSDDFHNETIEVAMSSGSAKNAILIAPKINNKLGASFFFGTNSTTFFVHDAKSSQAYTPFQPGFTSKTYSLTNNSCVAGRTIISSRGSKIDWDVNATGNTLLGKRSNQTYPFSGSIYSIRIYNRVLTSSEMIFNQNVDASRFGL